MYIGYVYPDGTVGFFPDDGTCLHIVPCPVENIIKVDIYVVYRNGYARRSNWENADHVIWYMSQGKWAQFTPNFAS